MTLEEIIRHTQELTLEQLRSIDKALGVIHELFPDIYDECGFVKWQAINTRELAQAENVRSAL